MFKLTRVLFEFDKTNSNIISDFVSGIGAISVAEDFINDDKVEICAYFPRFSDQSEIKYKIDNFIKFLINELGDFHYGPLLFEEIDESQWLVWKDILKTVRVTDRILIRPPWETYKPEQNEIVIEINPSMAFGTGHHESTRLCIKAAEEIVSERKNQNVLDVGCGSGILSIASMKLGAKKALAFDIDDVSVNECIKNIERNNFIGFIETRCCSIKEIDGKYDLIFANVYAEPLLNMKSQIKALLSKDGRVILSGIPMIGSEEIISGYQAIGFKLVKRLIEEDWIAFVFEH